MKELVKVSYLRKNLLPSDFYRRNTIEVAQSLLGKLLVVQQNDISTLDQDSEFPWMIGRIVETEAYRGDDPASHSSRGETPRCSVMFGDPGFAYVYFIYGMYEMLNFVTEPRGQPGAVLIRAVEPILGESLMLRRRNVRKRTDLTNGPGKLCRAFGIQMAHNSQSLMGPSLYVIDDGYKPPAISMSPRVGIRLGKEKEWRFFITNHPFVSRSPQNSMSRVVLDENLGQ